MLSAKKVVISVLLGLAGLAGSHYSLNYFIPPFSISIEWCDALPILAAMAFGGRYGLIAATLGLGAFYPLVLWPNDGWAAVVTSILLVLLYSAIGTFTGLRRKTPAFWNHPLIIYPLCVLIYNVLARVLFPIAFSLNPPFWNPAAELSIPTSILDGIIIKSIIILNLLVIFDYYLLKIPFIRKSFGLEIKPESRHNGWIALSSFFGSILVWYVLLLFNRIFIDETFPQGLFQIIDAHEILALVVFLSAGFFMGSIICQYVESRLRAEDELAKSRESYRQIFEQAADGIFITDAQGNYVNVNDSACRLTGHTREEYLQLNMRDVVMPEELNNVPVRIQEVNAGENVVFERRMRHKNGSPIDVEISARKLADGRLQGLVRDISDRKRAEERITQLVERFDLASQAAHLGVWDWDILHNQLVWDDRMYELYGVKKEGFTGAYETWLNGLHPDDRASGEEASQQARRGEKEYDTEFRVIWPNGKVHWLKAYGRVIRDANGEPLRMIGVNYDITERKQAEAALRESEARFRSLFDDSPISLWEEDFSAVKQRLEDLRASGVEDFNAYLTRHPEVVVQCAALVKVVDVNKATLNLYRAATKADMPTNLSGILPEGGYEQFRNELVLIASGVTHFEMEHVNQALNGIKKIVNLGWAVIFGYENDLSRTIVSIIDITERKQLEEARYASEENYRLIFDQSVDGIFITDAQANYIDVNPSGCALLGFTRAELLQRNIRDLVPKGDQRIKPLRLAEMKNGRTVVSERQITRKDGSLVDVEITAQMLPDGRFQGIVRDISVRKQAEEKIRRAQAELQRMFEAADESRLALLSVVEDQKEAEEQIRQLNIELEKRVNQRTAQLADANRELEAFAYSVSHDLRAPLRALDGFSNLLRTDYTHQLDEQGQHYLQRIHEASQRMAQLIADLLNLSRVTRAEINDQEVDLSAIARSIANELMAQAPERQVKFEIAADMLDKGDANLIRIALENLLNNAFKFTGQCEQARIEIGVKEQAGERIYFVSDNGVGFNMDYANKLFTPFQRLHSTQEFPGTGIGLSIAHRIITRHAGRIWPESEIGQGTTFYFTLRGRKSN